MNLMQFLIPIVSPIVQIILFFLGLLLAPVVEIRSLSDLNYNIEALLRETENLKSKRDDVLRTIQQGKRQGKTTTNKAENWLEDVNNVLVEVLMIKLDFDLKKTILNGHFTNYIARYKLARWAVRKLDDVKELNKKSLDDLITRPPPSRVVHMPTTATNSQTTSQRTVDEIWQCLQDDENWIICVYGMGGVGKTTLMKSVNNRLIGTQDFDVVVWITVSKEFNMERIQKEIGNSLGVYFSDDEPKRVILFSALKDLKYMLILDDLWHEFELEEAGIPKPNGQNGCKIVITTRFIQVGNAIEADKHIRVNTLTSEESWNLFCEKAGYVARMPQIRPLAEQVATECGGLPLAIITVGCAMRHKEKKELWLDALRSLRGSAPEIPGMEPKVFLSLKLSYDHLDDDKYKHCFLYCALFPEDYSIKI
ncbi:disease resistance protein At4g27190-like [Magnolia sinica]|uniref:disease resistance protein At4g27190-like n=1 Tax=Magnolia sinica TaxID=86752 RepID=UPI00265A4AA2|nr:disease resistance protein At4g27190-like [Magnolia sinica]